MTLRVRQILDKIGGTGRRSLNKFLPQYLLPSDTKGIFPATILASYNQYKSSEVGILTEKLVLLNETVDKQKLMSYLTHTTQEQKEKILKSKTTTDYLAKIQKTKEILNNYLKETHNLSLENALFNQELVGTNITGHPDAVIGTTIAIEVKTSSKLEDDQLYFIQQLSAYLALNPNFTHGILVLPLQQAIIVIDAANWSLKQQYLKALEEKAAKVIIAQPTINMFDLFNVNQLITHYAIGKHIHKSKTLLETVQTMSPEVPYQIFIGSNQSSHLNVKEADINAAGQWVRQHKLRVYIHAPYLINLAAKVEGDWNIKYMQKTMIYGAQLGALGVVVHVGKYTVQSIEEATEKMTNAVLQILESTDESCPLLIETPAGQGTEMLTKKEDYVAFIQQFETLDGNPNPYIGSCVDTCHVFACGYKPSEYISYIGDYGLLRLVHYNDSNDICGSCKDRHAFVGSGHIGVPEMSAVADYCGANCVAMVIE